jgi:hypothetical protein
MSEQEVKTMITKAAKSNTADEAMRYSQAACNAANALLTLASIKAAKG